MPLKIEPMREDDYLQMGKEVKDGFEPDSAFYRPLSALLLSSARWSTLQGRIVQLALIICADISICVSLW